MNIRTMLSIVLSLFVAISLTFISWRSYDIYLENNEDSWVRRTNELSDALIKSIAIHARERGLTTIMIRSDERALANEKIKLIGIRKTGDYFYNRSIIIVKSILDSYSSPPIRHALKKLDKHHTDVLKSRSVVDKLISGIPIIHADRSWMDIMNDYIDSQAELRRVALIPLNKQRSAFYDNIRPKELLYQASENASRERSVIALAIAESRRLNASEQNKIKSYENNIKANISALKNEISGRKDSVALYKALENFDYTYQKHFQKYRDAIISASAAGVRYPISKTEWVNEADHGVNAILAINNLLSRNTEQKLAYIFAKKKHEIGILALVTIFITLIVVAVVLLVRRHILAPLEELSVATARISNGALEIPVLLSGEGELGVLGRSFEQMRVSLLKDINEREEIENKLRTEKAEQEKLNATLKEMHVQLLQSEKMASIGQLAAGVAHEINNPVGYIGSNLATLMGYVEDLMKLLQLYEASDAVLLDQHNKIYQEISEQKERVDIEYLKEDLNALISESQEGVARVKQIVRDLKDFSHVDEAEWQYADVHKCLDSTLNIVHNELKYKADIVKDYADLPLIECMPSQLNQVIMNLLVNAAHAIEQHGVITVRTRMQSDSQVCIEISDTGKGIQPEHMSKLFDPFFTTKPVGQGTGLGLSLSYGIIEKHGGTIEVDSKAGKGTSFRILLPAQQAGRQAQGPAFAESA